MKTQIHIAIDIDTDKDGETCTDAGKDKRGLYSNPIQRFPTFTEDVLKKAPTEAK